MKKYQNTILAGTFDRLHAGHRFLIKKTIQKTNKISCFVTSDRFISRSQKVLKNLIQPCKKRLHEVKKILPKNTAFTPLEDQIGPAVSDNQFDSIAATKNTIKAVKLINKKRRVNNLTPLKIIKIKLKKDQSSQAISAARIRLGQINRQGLVYKNILSGKSFYLSKKNKRYFKKPFGIVHSSIPSKLHLSKFLIATVGDVTTKIFLRKKIQPDLAVFDCRVKRQPVACPVEKPNCRTVNQSSQISQKLIKTLIKIFNQPLKINKVKLFVKGEEDLVVIPIVLLSPLQSLVFYGQPNQGLVKISVTEAKKADFIDLLDKFSLKPN